MPDTDYLLLIGLFALAQRLIAARLLRRHSLSRRRLLALMELPGLYAHELSHGLVALIFGGAPSLLTVLPRDKNAKYRGVELGDTTQGAVIHCTSALFCPLVNAAPLLLVPLALLLPDVIPLGPRAWLGALLLRYGLPSRHDVKQLLPAIFILSVLAGAAVALPPRIL